MSFGIYETVTPHDSHYPEPLSESAAPHRLPLREVKTAIAAILSGAGDAEEDELTIASNASAAIAGSYGRADDDDGATGRQRRTGAKVRRRPQDLRLAS
jgi:hypothetical protein